MNIKDTFRCPVCRAKFRGNPECSRCGVDLSILLELLVKAQSYRDQARQAMLAENFSSAHQLALKAQKIHTTEKGRRMALITEWLKENS